jgi:hypothetical protein
LLVAEGTRPCRAHRRCDNPTIQKNETEHLEKQLPAPENGLASEAVHFAPSGHVGEATAGVMFFIYAGALLGPALFSPISGTVTAAFLLLGVLALLPVPLLL